MTLLLELFVGIVLLVALLGLLVPFFPGIFVMWLALLVYGILHGFSTFGIVLFVISTLLMILGEVADNVFMSAGAKQSGASCGTIVIGFVAGVAGTIFFPPFGGLIAAPLAVLLLEYLRLRDWSTAFMTVKGMAAGWGVALVVKLGVGVLLLVLWGLWVWRG